MDIECLRYFASAAKFEHFGKAAHALAVSQPALSRGIARVEEFYKVALFQRDGRGVRLTRPGRSLLRRVDRIVAEIDDARRELGDISSTRRNRPIAFGFVATLGLRVVPDAIRGFRTEHPAVDLQLLQAPSPVLQQRLLSGEIDLCISSKQFAEPTIDWLPLWDEELVLLIPSSHSAASLSDVDLSLFANDPFVTLKSNYGLRETFDMLCEQAHFEPNVSVESDAVVTLHGLVAAGFGVALIPKLYAAADPAVTTLHVRNPRCYCTFGLSWARGRYLPQSTVEFRDFLIHLLQQKRRSIQSATH